jgi:uncharacterized protein involved in cysteine biosynthesis
VLGLFPVVGQTVVPVVQALVAGFFLAVELLAIPLERRGLHLAGRLRFVWRHRAQTLGFGVTAFLLFLVPLMNVLAMPGRWSARPCWCGGSAARPGRAARTTVSREARKMRRRPLTRLVRS